MKQSSKATVTKKTIARKNVVAAQQQLDSQNRSNQINPQDYESKVAFKAYELYERRGYQHGNDLSDWFQAERLIKEGFGG